MLGEWIWKWWKEKNPEVTTMAVGEEDGSGDVVIL